VDEATTKFVIMVAVVVVSSAAGYAARRLGWLAEHMATRITLWIMIVGYPATGLLAVWTLKLRWADTWVTIQPVIQSFACFGLGLLVARWQKLRRESAGVFSYAAAHSNWGFTMGGFICLRLFGEQGLAYTVIYVTLWTIIMFGLFFPLAGRFAGRTERYGLTSFVRNLLDLRCLPLAGVLAGIGLSLSGIERPAVFQQWRIIDALVILCTAVMFFVTGLRLHVSQVWAHLRLYVWLAGIKFVFSPLLALGLIWLVQQAGMGLGDLPVNVMIVESFMPMALFAVAAANLYGLDAPLASSLFAANTVMFLVLVLPVITLGVSW
jgi:predicted permease